MKTVGELLTLYQRELIRLFKKCMFDYKVDPQEEPPEFHKLFNITLTRLKDS